MMSKGNKERKGVNEMYLKDKTMQICIRIDKETWKKVKIICLEKNENRSQYLRKLVYEAVSKDFNVLWENEANEDK